MRDLKSIIEGLRTSYSRSDVDHDDIPVPRDLVRNAIEYLSNIPSSTRRITKDEWQAWKKTSKYKRDPLCYMWVGDLATHWILNPESIHEPAYYMGDIVIFKGKPTEQQRIEVLEEGRKDHESTKRED